MFLGCGGGSDREANWGTNHGRPHKILTPIPGLSSLKLAAWIYASQIAGTDLSSPIGVSEAQHRIKGKLLQVVLQLAPTLHWLQSRSLGLRVPAEVGIVTFENLSEGFPR